MPDNWRVEHKQHNREDKHTDLGKLCPSQVLQTLATVENKWLSRKKRRPWKVFSMPNLVLHVEVRLHMLVVELHRGHGAVLVVILLLVPELPAESLRRAAQASAHYSEYLPREANSCEPAGTCSCAPPTTAMPLEHGFLHVRTSWRNGILTVTFEHTHINYLHSAPKSWWFSSSKPIWKASGKSTELLSPPSHSMFSGQPPGKTEAYWFQVIPGMQQPKAKTGHFPAWLHFISNSEAPPTLPEKLYQTDSLKA